MEKLRYPIGKFQVPQTIDPDLVAQWIDVLDAYPAKLQATVAELSEDQLDTVYRPGGWTVRQLVHHIADSHHNSYIRFKWALTEDRPVIKVYNEKKWSELPDAHTAPISLSLDHLKAVHARLVFLLRKLSISDLEREFIHPDTDQSTNLKENIGRYVWHGNHHLAHIQRLIEREGW